jgi:hypothetical protein
MRDFHKRKTGKAGLEKWLMKGAQDVGAPFPAKSVPHIINMLVAGDVFDQASITSPHWVTSRVSAFAAAGLSCPQ